MAHRALQKPSQGFKVMNLSDAAAWADVVMILTPDELQAQIYKNHIEQRAKEGQALLLRMD